MSSPLDLVVIGWRLKRRKKKNPFQLVLVTHKDG